MIPPNDWKMQDAMVKHGTPFIKHLGILLEYADSINYMALAHTFQDIFDEYREVAKRLEKETAR